MEPFNTYLFTQGILGVTVIALIFVINRLYNKTERLEKEKGELAEARRKDDVVMIEKVTHLVQEFTQSNKILSEKIEVEKANSRNHR